ncbi:MAG: SIS domain-containing protein [Rubrivivax sp.]|nr:SIS domain-containing protein [Rubrivivax sp.]
MTSLMLTEAHEAPQAVARFLSADAAVYGALAQRWQAAPPQGLLTLARGSSDHAAHYLAYLTMARLGRLVTSLPMSLLTLHGARFGGQHLGAVAFSQSGQSPDLVEPLGQLRTGGADTVAVVNDAASPLAQAAQWVLPLHAGPERSVAATKSFIAQLVAGARLVAAWSGDAALGQALQLLPAVLERALAQSWLHAVEVLQPADSLFVISRGAGMAVAQEVALKFKETCGIHAEAFSSAEVQHGPMALVTAGFPMLIMAPRGPAMPGLLTLADAMRQRGARVLLAAPAGTAGAELHLIEAADEQLDPVSAVQSFYPLVEALARARGHDPDQPRHLAKVTRTR